MLNAYLQLVPLDDGNVREKDGDDVDDKIRRKKRRKAEKGRDAEEDDSEVTGLQRDKEADYSSDDSSYSDDDGDIIDQRGIHENNNHRRVRFSAEQLKLLKKEKRTDQENQVLQQILGNHKFFKNIQQEISSASYSQLIGSTQLRIFQAFDPVFEVKEAAKECYIILSGSVLVLSPNTNQNSSLQQTIGSPSRSPQQQQQDNHNNSNVSQRALLDKKIASQYPNCTIADRLRAGDSFGEVGEHFGEISSRTDRKRTTNVICRKICQMAVISQTVFDAILAKYYQRSWEEKEKTVRSSEIFRDATRSFTTSIVMNIRRRTYHLDDIIYEEGSESSMLFLIKNGDVELSKKARFESNKSFLNPPTERIVIAQKTHNDCFGEVEMALEIPRDTRAKCVSSTLDVYYISKGRLIQTVCSQNAEDFLENLKISSKQIMKWRKQHYASMIKQILDSRDPFHRTFSSYEVGKQLFNQKFKKDFMNNQLQEICKVSRPEETEFTAKKVYFNNVRAYASKLTDVLGAISSLKSSNSSISHLQKDNQDIKENSNNIVSNGIDNKSQGKMVSSVSQKSQDFRSQELKAASLPHISSRQGSTEIRRRERSTRNNLRSSISTNISMPQLHSKVENNSSILSIQEQSHMLSSPLKGIVRNASFALKNQRNTKSQHINSLDCLPHIQDSLLNQSKSLSSSNQQATASKVVGQLKNPNEQAGVVSYKNRRSSSQHSSSNQNLEEQIIQRLLSQKKEKDKRLDSNLETADPKQAIDQSRSQQDSFILKSSLVSASSSNCGESINPMRLELSQLKKRFPFSMYSSPVKNNNQQHSPYFNAVVDKNYLEHLYDKISTAKYISTQSQETNKKILKEGMLKFCLQQRKPKNKESNDEDFTNLHSFEKFKLPQIDGETDEILSKIRFMNQLQLRQTLQRKYINSSLHKNSNTCNDSSLQKQASIEVLESKQSIQNISRKQSSSLNIKQRSSDLYQEPIISIKQININ